jgi:hypothetical protein
VNKGAQGDVFLKQIERKLQEMINEPVAEVEETTV